MSDLLGQFKESVDELENVLAHCNKSDKKSCKPIASALRKIRSLLSLDCRDCTVASAAISRSIILRIFSASTIVLLCKDATDESLRCCLPLIRVPSLMSQALAQLMSVGAHSFCLRALKSFPNNKSIEAQAIELLSATVSFVSENYDHKSLLASSSSSRKSKEVTSAFAHDLILNGIVTLLPPLTLKCAESVSASDLTIQRLIICM